MQKTRQELQRCWLTEGKAGVGVEQAETSFVVSIDSVIIFSHNQLSQDKSEEAMTWSAEGIVVFIPSCRVHAVISTWYFQVGIKQAFLTCDVIGKW